ncbi:MULTISPECIES: HdeD family acid-resistance protein [Thermomonospora]|uniref:HdeD family acid-resistance protein n=1 Tax=Thermomonospora curvata (strain ATCC 19995 / DSM 43183 / JCM 3096 / KCTC 9072 / NBRC 15933 / NCIMB 10081 / Henssen B9) TaxID=471852 RepID=D1AAK0_THECD|nr:MULTISPECIES: HdeD family acid-resistance protein [Thermomonospora]ACY98913.1 protein of unknown function DUF308 membrane [Thermomonospora curvata DSM 43183]PKK13111.1 MAG: hypothetical protein BUE48_016540 [Thermomonospora sp. CIF 1]
MIEQWARNWWTFAVRGAVAILFGLMAWIWPAITVWALVLLFGAYALVDGAFALAAAFRARAGQSRLWLAVTGAVGVLAGLLAFIWPGVTALVLLMLIAAWAVVTGVLEIVAAVTLRKELRGEWWYVIGGAVSVLFGLLLFVWPVSGALAVVWLIGLFAIVYGIALIAASLRIKRLGDALSSGRPGDTTAARF